MGHAHFIEPYPIVQLSILQQRRPIMEWTINFPPPHTQAPPQYLPAYYKK